MKDAQGKFYCKPTQVLALGFLTVILAGTLLLWLPVAAADGRSVGFVSDIEVDLEKGVIGGIVIPTERGFLNWFGRSENDILIKWEKVKTVGDDVILVDLGPQDVV